MTSPRNTVRRHTGNGVGSAGPRNSGSAASNTGNPRSTPAGVSHTANVAGAPNASTPSLSRCTARHPPRVCAANAARTLIRCAGL